MTDDKNTEMAKQPTREEIDQQYKNAFKEFLMSGELFGLNVAHKIGNVLWEDFQKYSGWRLDRLFEKPIKQHSQKNIRQIQKMAATRTPERPQDYLFIKIPKTATASINQFIKQYGGHRTASKWKLLYSPNTWDKIFKFSIVRNPYTRFVSAYYHAELDRGTDINEWLKSNTIEDARKVNEQLFMKQTEYLCDATGKLLVDYVGRFESLGAAWRKIQKMTKVEGKLPHLHRFERVERAKLTNQSRQKIYDYYKEDFERWNYEK